MNTGAIFQVKVRGQRIELGEAGKWNPSQSRFWLIPNVRKHPKALYRYTVDSEFEALLGDPFSWTNVNLRPRPG